VNILLHILATIPATTAQPERVFSKVEKTALAARASISEDRLALGSFTHRITVESASHFKCNIGEVSKSFYRSFTAIFGRVGRIAKENLTEELLMKKCLPTLLYATEVCPLNKSDI